MDSPVKITRKRGITLAYNLFVEISYIKSMFPKKSGGHLGFLQIRHPSTNCILGNLQYIFL